MSYEHGTPHYNLPQTVGTDKRDWFDTNEAFADVDADLYAAKTASETAVHDIETVEASVTALEGRVSTAEGDIDTLEAGLATANENIGINSTAIADVRTQLGADKQDLKDAICAIEEASATAEYRHEIGTFFWYNDTLYKTTVLIPVGQQIVPNVNCSTTNITTELLGGGGGSISADAVTFDNTGTDLSSTNVEDATKEVNTKINNLETHLTANNSTAGVTNVPFRFGCNDDGEYGYIITEGGADTVIPFKSVSGTLYVEDAGKIDVSNYEYVEVPRILDVSSGPTTYPSFTYTNPKNVAVDVKVKVSMTYSNVYNDAYMTVSVDGTEVKRVGLNVLVDEMFTVPANSTLVIRGDLYNPAQHSEVQQTIAGTVYAYDG